MTKNQIDYLKLLQAQNQAMVDQSLEKKKQHQTYELGLRNLSEQQRHNAAQENAAALSLGESIRHNQQTELLNNVANQEAQRANLAREVENRRTNFAKEQETHRANKAAEAISLDQLAQTAVRDSNQYKSNMASVALGEHQLAETSRANQAREELSKQAQDEQYRHNWATEQITKQGQDTQLKQNERKIDLDARKQSESERHGLFSDVAKSVDIGLDFINTFVKGRNTFGGD